MGNKNAYISNDKFLKELKLNIVCLIFLFVRSKTIRNLAPNQILSCFVKAHNKLY